jgi:hypothetical protein
MAAQQYHLLFWYGIKLYNILAISGNKKVTIQTKIIIKGGITLPELT